MKRTLILVLAALMVVGIVGCDGSKGNTVGTTTAPFTTPAMEVNASDELNTFFDNDTEGKVNAMAGVMEVFACAVQEFPEVLETVPSEEFGWTYLYNLLVYADVTTEGVTVKKDSVQVTADALETIQRDTLGGALWTEVPETMAEYILYDEENSLYTLKGGRTQSLGAYIEAVEWREDASCGELTVVVYRTDAGTKLENAVVGRYYIDLRQKESSAYGYSIAAFSQAE